MSVIEEDGCAKVPRWACRPYGVSSRAFTALNVTGLTVGRRRSVLRRHPTKPGRAHAHSRIGNASESFRDGSGSFHLP